jgi:hypothetical protein
MEAKKPLAERDRKSRTNKKAQKKKALKIAQMLIKKGFLTDVPERIRTSDPSLRSQILQQKSKNNTIKENARKCLFIRLFGHFIIKTNKGE